MNFLWIIRIIISWVSSIGAWKAISAKMRTAALLRVSMTSRRVSACMSDCCRKMFGWSIRWKDQDSTKNVVSKTAINAHKNYQKEARMETLLFGALWREIGTWKTKSKNWSISMKGRPRPLVRLEAHKNGRVDFNALRKEEIAMRTSTSSCWGSDPRSTDCCLLYMDIDIWTGH